MTEKAFTPAAGRFVPASFYDAFAALSRERLWRGLVVDAVAARPGDVIVDVGCGTGSLALLLHRSQPAATVVGLDPDPRIVGAARRKAAGAPVDWRVGMGDTVAATVGPESATVLVSTLVLHQCPMAVKRAVLASMWSALRPGGRLVIADFGRQRTQLMRAAFRIVQLADGFADTQPNADGVLPELIAGAGFDDVREAHVVPTVAGSISIYTARRA